MVITFKAALKAKLEAMQGWEGSLYHSAAPAIEELLERWLKREATIKQWDEIATKHPDRSREATFQRIINMACEALEMSDPQHGLASPQAIDSHQRHIDELEELAACAEKLAKHTRHNERNEALPRRNPEPPVRIPWRDRARLYEEEAKKFHLRMARWKASSRTGRQTRNNPQVSSRLMFMQRMSSHMRRAFDDKPYHAAVAVLTDLAHPRKGAPTTTPNEVAQAWKRREEQRKKMTTGAQ